MYGSFTIYNAFGSVLSESSVANRFMFTGREYDPETGNYYYRARFYNPQTGRFLSRDPVGYADSMNLYQYCGNNPIMFVDPMGLCRDSSDSSDSFLSDLWAGKYFGTGYGESSMDIWAARAVASDTWYGKAGNSVMGGLAALWTPETWKQTTVTLVSAGFSAQKAANIGTKYTVEFYKYKNAGGGGLNLIKEGGRRVAGLDWHQWGQTTKNIVTKSHIDIKGVVRHFPWEFLGLK